MQNIVMTIKGRNGEPLRAFFESQTEAMDVYKRLFDALLDADEGSGFELGLEVLKDE